MARLTREEITAKLEQAQAAGTIRNVDYREIADAANRAMEAACTYRNEELDEAAGNWNDRLSQFVIAENRARDVLWNRPHSVLHVPGWLRRADKAAETCQDVALKLYREAFAPWVRVAQLLIALRPMIVKGRIIREKTEAELAAEAAENARKRTCQICGKMHQVSGKRRVMVLHGYERPGRGYVIGDCFGHGAEPFEVSRARLGEYIGILTAQVTRHEAEAIRLKGDIQQVTIERRNGPATVKRDADGFEAARREAIFDQESMARQLTSLIKYQQGRFDRWTKTE